MKRDRSGKTKEEEGTGRQMKGTHEEVAALIMEMSMLAQDSLVYGLAYY